MPSYPKTANLNVDFQFFNSYFIATQRDFGNWVFTFFNTECTYRESGGTDEFY